MAIIIDIGNDESISSNSNVVMIMTWRERRRAPEAVMT